MSSAILARMHDSLFKNLHKERGWLSSMARELRKEQRDQKKLYLAKKAYIDAVKTHHEIKLANAVMGSHGYLRILREEMGEHFRVLHKLLRIYAILLKDMEDLAREALDRTQLPGEVKRIALKEIKNDYLEIRKGLDRLLSDLAGIDSLTVSSFKLYDEAGQFQEIIGELKTKARRAFKSYDKEQKKSRKELEQFEKKIKQDLQINDMQLLHNSLPHFDPDHPNKSLRGQLGLAVKELMTITDQLVIMLHEIHGDMEAFIGPTSQDPPGNTPLGELDPQRMPSLDRLKMPYPQGFGLSNHVFADIAEFSKKIQREYQDQLKKTLEETRLFISKEEHHR